MRLGLLPSQKRELDRAFKKAKAFDRFRVRTRRAFLGLGLGAVGTGVLGFWVGRDLADARPETTDDAAGSSSPRIAIARRLASASDEQLWRERHTFLLALDECRGDPEAWVGFRRLGAMALARSDESRRVACARLVKTGERAPGRADFGDLMERLRRAAQ
ncbi:MAG: hypothetical protein R3F56_08375 [Planctomycetota bacterium]